MDKRIKLVVNGKALSFNVGMGAYNAYLNELTPNNKITPARMFLLRTVDLESRAALDEVLSLPSAGLQIAGKLLEAYTPDLEIELGE